MTLPVDKWTWVGVGSLLMFLCLIALIWLCKLFKWIPEDRLSPINFVKRRQRLRNVTVTLKREITRINRFTEARSLSQSSVHSFYPESLVWEFNEEQDFASDKKNSINNHRIRRFKYFQRNFTSADQDFQRSFNQPRSLYDGCQSRSMSRILWQDLTMTTTDAAIVEEEYAAHSQDLVSVQRRESSEIRKVFKTSRRIFRQAWGENSVKIFLFAKLVAGYFTVDRSGKLCKVNDWRHVSGEDLRYREKAIFELVCLNQLHVELIHDA